jgi:hypothetical protein
MLYQAASLDLRTFLLKTETNRYQKFLKRAPLTVFEHNHLCIRQIFSGLSDIVKKLKIDPLALA